jgi:protein-disulfide isomerase
MLKKGDAMKPSKCRLFIVLCALITIFCSLSDAGAKIEWSILKNIPLDDTPRDVAITREGATAYILCSKSVQVYSIAENRITDTIPLTGEFSQLALSPDGEQLFLTRDAGKQLTIIQISQVYDIPRGTSPVIGKATAPVTVVAFLDYQCPYCSRVYPALEQLIKQRPSDVNLVIKHYPLPMHRFAEKASLAALAAARQNKYQEMTKELFSDFQNLNDENIPKHAQAAGLDVTKFNTDYNDPALKKQVEEDRQLGMNMSVRGVPALFLNGRVVKDRSVQGLSSMVDEELKKAK